MEKRHLSQQWEQITEFVANENDSRAEELISVVHNGASVGKAFYINILLCMKTIAVE